MAFSFVQISIGLILKWLIMHHFDTGNEIEREKMTKTKTFITFEKYCHNHTTVFMSIYLNIYLATRCILYVSYHFCPLSFISFIPVRCFLHVSLSICEAHITTLYIVKISLNRYVYIFFLN
jgi:hypothetical protein